MIQPQLEQMMEKLEHFPPERLAEVKGFIDFLQQRDQDRLLRQDYAYAQEAGKPDLRAREQTHTKRIDH